MDSFFVKQNYYQRICQHHYCSLYFLIIIAFLLLGFTNANNNTTTDTGEGFIDKVKIHASDVWQYLKSGIDNDSTTMTNETMNENETSIFHKPRNISDVQIILYAILRLLAQAFLIFGGVIPYIPQYLIIKRKQNAEGFSNYVCLTLLVANIIRIEFWLGKHFEIPLLLQSIVMIICMLIMLELWTRIHAQTMRRQLSVDVQNISSSKEQLTEEIADKKFTDFQVDYFWRWTRFTSYLQFLFIFIFIITIVTIVFKKNVVYIETIGFLAVFVEALLGIPQFIRNFTVGSTEGMSVKMVLLWLAGDVFKTVYFILRDAPKQFWLCGMLQIGIDIAILCQVILYSKKCGFRRQ